MLVLWWLCHYYYVEPNFCVFLSLPGYSFPFEATVTIQEHCHTATSSFQVAEAMFQSSSVGSSLNSVAALVAVAKMLWFSAYSRSLMLLLGMPCLMLRISSLFCFVFFFPSGLLSCYRGGRHCLKAASWRWTVGECYWLPFTYWLSSCMDNATAVEGSGFACSCLERQAAWFKSMGEFMFPAVTFDW